MTREELIAKLEMAGPGREVDFWLWWYGASTESRVSNPGVPDEDYVRDKIGYAWIFRPSAEIADALRLVPEGWEWSVSNRTPEPRGGRAYLNNRELQHTGMSGLQRNPKYRGCEVVARTPALALCIAAIKARMA